MVSSGLTFMSSIPRTPATDPHLYKMSTRVLQWISPNTVARLTVPSGMGVSKKWTSTLVRPYFSGALLRVVLVSTRVTFTRQETPWAYTCLPSLVLALLILLGTMCE